MLSCGWLAVSWSSVNVVMSQDGQFEEMAGYVEEKAKKRCLGLRSEDAGVARVIVTQHTVYVPWKLTRQQLLPLLISDWTVQLLTSFTASAVSSCSGTGQGSLAASGYSARARTQMLWSGRRNIEGESTSV